MDALYLQHGHTDESLQEIAVLHDLQQFSPTLLSRCGHFQSWKRPTNIRVPKLLQLKAKDKSADHCNTLQHSKMNRVSRAVPSKIRNWKVLANTEPFHFKPGNILQVPSDLQPPWSNDELRKPKCLNKTKRHIPPMIKRHTNCLKTDACLYITLKTVRASPASFKARVSHSFC